MKKVFLFIILLLIVSPVFATDAPQWTGKYVNDYAGVLNNSAQLEYMLQELQSNTTIEFVVVTLSSLPSDETKETYAYKIFNTWGIGKEKEDNGLLFLMLVNGTPGNRMRLEIGYGLEGYITDASAGRILDKSLPSYEQGDYSQTAYIVVSEVKTLLEGNYIPGQAPSSDVFSVIADNPAPFIWIIIFVIVIVATVSGRERCPNCKSKDLKDAGEYWICNKCGTKFKKKVRRIVPLIFFAGGGGGGGFGGGGSGGGGAGR